MIIGIAGGSGSGKTTLLNRLLETYAHLRPAALRQDNYYFPKEAQERDAEGWINFDLPTAIDHFSFLEDLLQLKNGKVVKRKEYTYNVPGLEQKELIIEPSSLIFVEGLYVFQSPEIREELEVRILLQTEQKLQFERRLKRDQRERGLSHEEIHYQWEKHVLPCYENYLQPFEVHADFLFNNTNDFDRELERLKAYIDERIQHA